MERRDWIYREFLARSLRSHAAETAECTDLRRPRAQSVGLLMGGQRYATHGDCRMIGTALVITEKTQ